MLPCRLLKSLLLGLRPNECWKASIVSTPPIRPVSLHCVSKCYCWSDMGSCTIQTTSRQGMR